MKYLILVLVFMTACSHAPVKKLYKNCQEAGAGSNFFYCEEIPAREIGKR